MDIDEARLDRSNQAKAEDRPRLDCTNWGRKDGMDEDKGVQFNNVPVKSRGSLQFNIVPDVQE